MSSVHEVEVPKSRRGAWCLLVCGFVMGLSGWASAQKSGMSAATVMSPARQMPPVAPPLAAVVPVGDWLGTLETGGVQLKLVFHLTVLSDGSLAATVDSIDEGAKGIPVAKASVQGGVVTLDLSALAASFVGTLNSSGDEILGTWSQRGLSVPLALKRVAVAPVVRRPQVPVKPYPYREEEVGYRNPVGGVTLAGTLTIPAGEGPFPALLMITGSGPEDRDETVFGHKPFLVLADDLTRKGYVTLRVDDRGVGGSSAGPPEPTSEEFAGDVLTGIQFLKRRKEVDAKRIGLLGHSEGGMIAPMVAVRSADIAFLVLLAPPGLPGERILRLQSEAILRAAGGSDEDVMESLGINERVYAIVKSESDPKRAEPRIREVLTAAGVPPQFVEAQIKGVLTGWFRFFLSYDPASVFAKVRVPVLALFGERDLQVIAEPNLKALQTALGANSHPKTVFKTLPGLNHLMQECRTGTLDEYPKIEQTIAPAALEAVSSWLAAVTGQTLRPSA
jgi:pimeloyl-ACP methyl ester carboxylesterase